MNFEDKIEEMCNKMIEDGQTPGAIYLNKRTLAELAKSFEPQERVIIPLAEGEPLDVKNPYKSERTGMILFKVDNTLADDELVVKSVLEESGEVIPK